MAMQGMAPWRRREGARRVLRRRALQSRQRPRCVGAVGMASLRDSLNGPSHLARNQDSQLLISTLISVVQAPSVE